MKRYTIILSLVVLCSFFTHTVDAASLIIKGTAESEAKGITVLVLDKGADVSDHDKTDVVYINQSEINSDGTFTLTLPYLNTEGYDFYSNMKINITEDTSGLLDVAYVSASGSDSGDGSSARPFATLSKACNALNRNGKIIVKDSATYVEASKKITVEGETNAAVLMLGSEINLKNDLTLTNITLNGSSTIYANGYALTVENSVSGTERLNVYGGGKSKNISGNTNITLLGGKYKNIYGGCYNGQVLGDSYVILGGTANSGDDIDDANTSTWSPCMVYGGGNNGAVSGKTNITIKDNAVARYLIGSGTGSGGTVVDTNICIEGGKVTGVYGGSIGTALPDGTTTHITMTGGAAEAIFGGCKSVDLVGHTFIKLLGGQVTRRVYSGCYNEVSFGVGLSGVNTTWSSLNHVKGTTNLSIGPEVSLNTKDGLSEDNSVNVGVFAGSRMESQSDEEQNTIIYLDGCYSTHNTYIGEKSKYKNIISLSPYLKSFEDYVVKSSDNGNVAATTASGTVYVAPDRGYVASVGEKEYENENVVISAGTTEITFIEKDFFINSLTAGELTATGLNGSANIFANNRAAKEEPKIYIALYDADRLVDVDIKSVTKSDDNITFKMDCELEKGKTYTVKAMIWDKNIEPLTASYEIMVS